MGARTHCRSDGFTIVELMVTLAIIGILASLAIPRYSDYLRRASLPEAFSRLGDLRIKLEQFYQSNRNYGTGACGNDGSRDTIDFAVKANKFTITCQLTGVGAGAVDQAYLLTATGSGLVAGHVYTLDSSNNKRTLSFKGASSSAACWLVKGDEC